MPIGDIPIGDMPIGIPNEGGGEKPNPAAKPKPGGPE